MSEIEMKIKEHTEDIAKICDMLTRSLQNHLDGGIDKANTQETGAVVDMIKDLAIAKEKAIKGLYYAEILEAMQGKEYGEEYDEDGPRYYRGRSQTTGRFMHRPYTEPGDMIKVSRDGEKMYYTEAGTHNRRSYEDHARGYEEGQARGYEEGHERGYTEGRNSSRYEKARRGYEDAGRDKEKRTASLNEYLHTITDDLTKMIEEMDTNEKQILRNKLQAIQNKIS